MAERTSIFSIFLALCFSVALSRTLPSQTPQKTTLLDVSASIQKTLDLFSPESTQLSQLRHTHSPQPTKSLSFHLHSRSTAHKAQHRDYKSLTLARLARDAARAETLQTRLDLAVNRISLTDLEPENNNNNDDVVFDEEEEVLQGPVVSGTSQGSGEYFLRVGIGQPPSQVSLVIDTGSDVNWVQCAPCADCYTQTDPIYNPSNSTSFYPLTCNTDQCRSLDVSSCFNNTCMYEVSYGDGSYTVGDFVTETISFAGGGSDAVSNIAIGCGHNNEGLFVGASGLIGLGAGSLSFPSQINASSFSYCLVDRDSDNSSLLEFNSGMPYDGVVTAPIIKNSKLDTFYYVALTGLSVSGELLSIPPATLSLDQSGNGGVIVDCGTAVTRLQTAAYGSLRDAFRNGTKGLRRRDGGVALFDTCYDMSGMKSVEVPTVAFRFSNGKELELPAKNYMIPVDSNGTFCFAFAPTESSLSIIGNVQQQGIRVDFDIANSMVGFSPSSC